MSWNPIAGNWTPFHGSATPDQAGQTAAKRDILCGKLQESYGLAQDDKKRLRDLRKTARADFLPTHR